MSLKKLITCAVLVAAALVCSATTARAAFTITLSESGFASKTFTFAMFDPAKVDVSGATTNSMSIGLTYGDFEIQADIGTSNAKSAMDPAKLSLSNTSVRNLAAGSKTLTITVTDTGFTAPANTAVLMQTQLSTTSLTNPGDSVSFQSFLNGSGGSVLTLLTAPAGAGPVFDNKTVGATYTLSNVTTVNVSTGGLLQSTGNTTVTAVPAPAGLALVLAGVPVLGVGGWLRRRLKKA